MTMFFGIALVVSFTVWLLSIVLDGPKVLNTLMTAITIITASAWMIAFVIAMNEDERRFQARMAQEYEEVSK